MSASLEGSPATDVEAALEAARRGRLPPLTYLTIDSLAEGVGMSQVLPYVERLARRGLDVDLHSFEKGAVDPSIGLRLADAGVRWKRHRFGSRGAGGGLDRVARGAVAVAKADLVHARSDLPAASAMLSRRRRWVWDMRGFLRQEKIGMGTMRAGSLGDRALAGLEAAAARSSAGIVTLSQVAVDDLSRRFGAEIRDKSRVITTCVDLDRFQLSEPPPRPPVRFLLSGTLNRLYDVPAMVRLVERVRARCAAELTVLTPNPDAWLSLLSSVSASTGRVGPAAMPDQITAHHVGLGVQRPDPGATGAATPTKLGEFLACGRPVVVNVGVGDMAALLARHDCGVVIEETSDQGLERAADDLDRLLEDPGTAKRCRALAEEHFDLERGVDRLVALYHQVSS